MDPFRGYATRVVGEPARRGAGAGRFSRRPARADPLFGIRRLRRRAPETLSSHAWARLEAGLKSGDPVGEVTQAWMAAHELRFIYHRSADLPDARRRLHDVLQRCIRPRTAPPGPHP